MGRWELTHSALQRAALELFEQKGYDATSTAQVAARAGVSEMTLFRHFTSKAALVLDDPFDPLLADAVRSRPPDEPAMRALAEGMRQAWRAVQADQVPALRARLRIIATASTVSGAVERNSRATIAALAGALEARDVAAMPAAVAATAVVSGMSVALLEWARSERSLLNDALDGALRVLGGS